MASHDPIRIDGARLRLAEAMVSVEALTSRCLALRQRKLVNELACIHIGLRASRTLRQRVQISPMKNGWAVFPSTQWRAGLRVYRRSSITSSTLELCGSTTASEFEARGCTAFPHRRSSPQRQSTSNALTTSLIQSTRRGPLRERWINVPTQITLHVPPSAA